MPGTAPTSWTLVRVVFLAPSKPFLLGRSSSFSVVISTAPSLCWFPWHIVVPAGGYEYCSPLHLFVPRSILNKWCIHLRNVTTKSYCCDPRISKSLKSIAALCVLVCIFQETHGSFQMSPLSFAF